MSRSRLPPWRLLTSNKLAGFGVAVGLLLAAILLGRESGWVPVLDHANLVFHEAGHVIYGVFGSTLGLYGGTLGQLTFPAICAGVFWWRRHPASAALCGVWLFENLLNIARYVADARAQVLPLVGGGDHDWTRILLRWGALQQDTGLATAIQVVGWVGMLACVAWVVLRWSAGRRQQEEHSDA
jgi:hypothetical protein